MSAVRDPAEPAEPGATAEPVKPREPTPEPGADPSPGHASDARDTLPKVSTDGASAPAPSGTYYDLPVVKAPPWKAYIPAYFYAGGAAGAAAVLASAVELAGGRRLAPLGQRLRWIATVGEVVGSVLLVADLGRPARFHRMLRAARITSPMSVGSWILSASASASGLATLRDLVGLPPSRALGVVGAAAGGMLATYTGVLLGNTAIPVWSATRNELPLLFAASGAASAASLLELWGPRRGAEARTVRAFAAASKLAELAASAAVERSAGEGRVGAPLREGTSGAMWRAAKWLQIGSVMATGASALAPRGTAMTRLAGALGTAAGIAMRFAIMDAGRASAGDPRATFEPQRARREARSSAS